MLLLDQLSFFLQSFCHFGHSVIKYHILSYEILVIYCFKPSKYSLVINRTCPHLRNTYKESEVNIRFVLDNKSSKENKKIEEAKVTN